MRAPLFLFLLLLPGLPILASCAPRGDGPGADGNMVMVETVDGVSLPMGRILARAVAEELGILGIAAGDGPIGDHPFVIRGWAVPGRNGLTFRILAHWALINRQGQVVGAYTQEVQTTKIQWEYGDPQVIQAMTAAAAEALAPLIPTP